MTVIYRISFHLAQYIAICRAQKIRFSNLNFPFCCPLYSASCGAHCTQPPDHRSFVWKTAGASYYNIPKIKTCYKFCVHLSASIGHSLTCVQGPVHAFCSRVTVSWFYQTFQKEDWSCNKTHLGNIMMPALSSSCAPVSYTWDRHHLYCINCWWLLGNMWCDISCKYYTQKVNKNISTDSCVLYLLNDQVNTIL